MVSPLQAVRHLVEAERLGAVVTVVDGPDTGAKGVLDRADGLVAGAIPTDIAADVVADASNLMDREQSRTLTYGNRQAYIETVAPQPRLLIFGAVHIAQELCKMAHGLGFRVIVNDARPFFTTEERFPEAERVIVGWPEQVADRLQVDGRTYVVLLSHDARFEDPVDGEPPDAPPARRSPQSRRIRRGADRPHTWSGGTRHRGRATRRGCGFDPCGDDPGSLRIGFGRLVGG